MAFLFKPVAKADLLFTRIKNNREELSSSLLYIANKINPTKIKFQGKVEYSSSTLSALKLPRHNLKLSIL